MIRQEKKLARDLDTTDLEVLVPRSINAEEQFVIEHIFTPCPYQQFVEDLSSFREVYSTFFDQAYVNDNIVLIQWKFTASYSPYRQSPNDSSTFISRLISRIISSCRRTHKLFHQGHCLIEESDRIKFERGLELETEAIDTLGITPEEAQMCTCLRDFKVLECLSLGRNFLNDVELLVPNSGVHSNLSVSFVIRVSSGATIRAV